MFDYLNDHNATSKLAYVQIGNESDGDYAKKTVLHRSVTIRMIFTGQNTPIWWKNLTISSGQGRLKQNSHRVKWRSVAFGGFQGPTLEYLSGKIDEKEILLTKIKDAKAPAVSMYMIIMIFLDIRNIREGRLASREIASIRFWQLKNSSKYE